MHGTTNEKKFRISIYACDHIKLKRKNIRDSSASQFQFGVVWVDESLERSPIRFSSYVFIRLNGRQKSHKFCSMRFSTEFKYIDMCNECATNNTLAHRIFFRFDNLTIGFGCGGEEKEHRSDEWTRKTSWSENKIANGIEYCILRTLHSLFKWEWWKERMCKNKKFAYNL